MNRADHFSWTGDELSFVEDAGEDWEDDEELEKAEFHESQHERDSHGRFGAGGGGAAVVITHPHNTGQKAAGMMRKGVWGDPGMGGSYRRLDENSRGTKSHPIKVEIHHMPAAEASPLNPLNGPAIVMSEADHELTASNGSRASAKEYRNVQRKLISEGKFKEAQQMDIDDIRSKFGNKYDEQIKQMQNYTKNVKFNRNNIPKNPSKDKIRAKWA